MSNWSSPHEPAACFCKSAMTLGSGIFFDRDVLHVKALRQPREDIHMCHFARARAMDRQFTITQSAGMAAATQRKLQDCLAKGPHSLGEVNFGCWKVGKCFGTSMFSANSMEHRSKKSSIDHLVRDTSPVRASGASCARSSRCPICEARDDCHAQDS